MCVPVMFFHSEILHPDSLGALEGVEGVCGVRGGRGGTGGPPRPGRMSGRGPGRLGPVPLPLLISHILANLTVELLYLVPQDTVRLAADQPDPGLGVQPAVQCSTDRQGDRGHLQARRHIMPLARMRRQPIRIPNTRKVEQWRAV